MNPENLPPVPPSETVNVISRHGNEVTILGRAAGSDANVNGSYDSVWAKRHSDGAVRCYYLWDLFPSTGTMSDYATTFPVIDKETAAAAARR